MSYIPFTVWGSDGVNTANAVNAIPVTSSHIIEGQVVIETTCRDYDHYRSLPDAVTYNGVVCGKTGWNSDRGYACYKSGVALAYPTK